jgi:uncharacterized protein YkwD
MKTKWAPVGLLVVFLVLLIGILALPAYAAQAVEELPSPIPLDTTSIGRASQAPEAGTSISYHEDPTRIAGTIAYTSYLPVIRRAPGGGTTQPTIEDELIDLINAERSSRGLGTLKKSNVLMRVAEAHSQDMRDRDFVSHINPDGLYPSDRLDNAGYTYWGAGENIGAGQSTAQEMFDDWMASTQGHRETMLDPAFTEIGIGYVAGGSWGHYWTGLFATPK